MNNKDELVEILKKKLISDNRKYLLTDSDNGIKIVNLDRRINYHFYFSEGRWSTNLTTKEKKLKLSGSPDELLRDMMKLMDQKNIEMVSTEKMLHENSVFTSSVTRLGEALEKTVLIGDDCPSVEKNGNIFYFSLKAIGHLHPKITLRFSLSKNRWYTEYYDFHEEPEVFHHYFSVFHLIEELVDIENKKLIFNSY